MTKYILVVSALTIFGVILPWRRSQRLSTDELLNRIPTERFKGMDDYLDSENWPYAEFWATTGGMRGVYERFCHMTAIVRLLQIQIRAGTISKRDASHVWNKAIVQIWFTFWVPLETLFCRMNPRIPHVAALYSLRSHYQLTLSTVTLCSVDNTHISATRLYGML